MDTTKLKDKLDGKVQGLQEPVSAPTAPMAPVSSGYVALSNNALDVIRENLKNQPLWADPPCFRCRASPGRRRRRN